MARILVIEDGYGKAVRVKNAAEDAGFEVVITPALETAKGFIKENEVEAIVVDNKFFLEEEKSPVAVHGAGDKLLDWLEEQGRKIPVLGFSNVEFKSTYPYFWGQMKSLVFVKNTFEAFISSLKDQSN